MGSTAENPENPYSFLNFLTNGQDDLVSGQVFRLFKTWHLVGLSTTFDSAITLSNQLLII